MVQWNYISSNTQNSTQEESKKSNTDNDKHQKHTLMNNETKITIIALASIIVLIAGLMWIIPQYRVWSQEMKGRAEFRRAEQNKQIMIITAQANYEAEVLNARAEVARARGAAEAIEIEGGMLTENYIRYLWVRQQSNLNDRTIIYIPTEAGLPVLEANRFR